MTKDELKNRISMALKDPILQHGFEIICKNLSELEKENAELKEKLNFSTQYYQGEKAKDQLTKAKEILRDLIKFQPYIDKEAMFLSVGNEWKTVIYKAKQFLEKESE